MKNLHVIQVSTKQGKSTNGLSKAFLRDNTNNVFLTAQGSGIDLSCKLACEWFAIILENNKAIEPHISSIAKQVEHKSSWVATDLMKIIKGYGEQNHQMPLSFKELMRYLELVGVINHLSNNIVDHLDRETGQMYILDFIV